jgi:hypothetical protein
MVELLFLGSSSERASKTLVQRGQTARASIAPFIIYKESNMKKLKVYLPAIASLVVGAFAANASAALPDGGWYYSTALNEQGFNIEIQDNTLFVAGFTYDASGNPIWVVSGGVMQSDHTYTGTLYKTSGGQTIGGAPREAVETEYGTISLTWTTTANINATLNGHSFALVRNQFGIDFTSTTQPLLGELSFVEGIGGVFFGDRITFTHTQIVNGQTYAVGYASGNTSRLATGQYVPGLGKWTILLDSSPSYYEYFTLTFTGVNFVEGEASTYLKGSSPNGSLPTVGYRTESAQKAAGQNAPGSVQSVPVDVVGSDNQRAMRVAAQGRESNSSDPELLRQMETVLRAR